MARVKKSKKNDPSYRRKSNSKFTPCERFLRFQVTHPAGAGETSHYIDLAAQLSKVNRRLYRQGRVYRIANISVTSRDTVAGLVSFSSAPETWVTRNAWNRGFEFFELMNKKVLDMPGQQNRKGQWHDYKVYLSDDHRTAASARKPGIRDNGNQQYLNGEWVYSTYQSPDGSTSSDEYTAHLLGDHSGTIGAYNSIGLIKSYGESRGTVNGNVPQLDDEGDDDPLLNLFDYGTEIDEIAQDLDSDNDRPPYGWDAANIGEYYPGSDGNGSKPVVRRLAAIGTPDTGTGAFADKGVAAPTVMLPGFDAICGLIEIETQSDLKTGLIRQEDDIIDIIIELAPGNYKGVAAFDI